MAVRLAVTELGSGPPLLVLHGLLGSARNLGAIAQRLAASHRVIALDLRNHGASDWAESMDYADMAQDVLTLVRERELGPVGIVGHSMGGKVAMLTALSHGAQVARLAVIDIAPVAYPPVNQPYIDAMKGIDLSAAERRGDVDRQLAPLVPDLGIRQFLLQNLVVEDGRLRWRVNLPVIDRSMPEISGFPVLPAGAVYDGPSLFVGGGRSDYLRPGHHGAIRDRFPHARIETVADAGHWVHAERPDALLELLEPFLAGRG